MSSKEVRRPTRDDVSRFIDDAMYECTQLALSSLIPLVLQAKSKKTKDELVTAVLEKRERDEKMRLLQAQKKAEAVEQRQKMKYFENQVSPPKEHKPLVGRGKTSVEVAAEASWNTCQNFMLISK